MKLIETVIRDGIVRLLYADASTKDEASEWVEMQLKGAEADNQRLGVIQKDALLRLQVVIDAEMTRFRTLSGQILE